MAYWNIFGHFSDLPLDTYHMKQLFISISEITAGLDVKYAGKKRTFVIPMLVLAIRMSVNQIFRKSYPNFFAVEVHDKIATKLCNDLITELVDPNLMYSRFSFFESGRDAIGIKYAKARKSESRHQKFFRRSALVEQLFPSSSEGRVRALFGLNNQALQAKTHELRMQSRNSPQR